MFRRFLAAIVGIMVCINLLWVPPIQGAGDNSLIRVKLASMGSPKSVNVYVNGNYGVPQIDKNNILAKETIQYALNRENWFWMIRPVLKPYQRL